MGINIEQLRIEVDDIKKSLNDLQNNVDFSEAEKRAKAEDLKNQAEITKQSIQDIIKVLENGTDDTSKMEKERAEALLNSFNDITILYNSIINPSTNPNINPSTNT
jgi:CTP-dependent riboflavin kinase